MPPQVAGSSMNSTHNCRRTCLRLAVALASLTATVRASDPVPSDPAVVGIQLVDPDTNRIDVDSLYAKILALEEAELNRSASEAKAAEKKAADDFSKKSVFRKAPNSWSERSKEEWDVKLGGHIQIDTINWANASPSIIALPPNPGPTNYLAFRRLRLVADGTGYGVYDFRLQMTLEPETVGESETDNTTANIKDAYVSVNEIPALGRMRLGHFFVPFSLEQVTNDTNNIFLERSIPTQGIFAPDREIGVAFYNCTEDERVTWTTGLFYDSISEATKILIDDNQGLRLSGRLTCLPVYNPRCEGRYLVHTGFGILHTEDQNDQVRFRARPQIHQGPRLISTPLLNASSFTTGNIEFASVMGPVTIQSEAFLSQVNLTSLPAESIFGAYAHISYFVTGENRQFEAFGQHGPQFGRNTPTANFLWTKDHFSPGAVELKARWSTLNFDSVNSGQYNDLTLGTNWYWNDRMRWMFDYIHPLTSEQAVFGSTRSDILGLRFDVNW
ncbi:MAG: porin [Planctomycetota bacterium]|nr:porin [Planctomycetota bacterium]